VDYRKLGNTDLKVSSLCLGTMTWGIQNTQDEAHKQLDYALERGINFIDTAEMYPVPPTQETYAKTEEIIGNWSKLHSKRDDIILATKIAGPGFDYIRDGELKLNKKHMKEACEASLKRLKIETIDLYQLHWPERQTNYFGQRGYTHNENEVSFTPILERLEAMQELVNEGKVKHFGLSNETPWGVMQYLSLAKTHNLPRIVSIQNPYNLLNRTFETGLAEMAIREKMGLLAYSPLAFGMLSGKYRHGQKPKNARLTMFDRFTRYLKPLSSKATDMYCDLAQELEVSPATLALAYVSSRNFVTSNIIGATTMEQLIENIDSNEFSITSEIAVKIDEIHELIPNPSP
jgi:aryl-alcohol dehydrogenase-like predicted oxidoreductase